MAENLVEAQEIGLRYRDLKRARQRLAGVLSVSLQLPPIGTDDPGYGIPLSGSTARLAIDRELRITIARFKRELDEIESDLAEELEGLGGAIEASGVEVVVEKA
jgi:hypothetical protein